MFDGFETRDVETRDTSIRVRIGGAGPPLLLLHGYPQTHAMWHRVAPALAEHYTVMCADLRGYGDSGKPASDPEHAAYSKRAMAQDMVEAMAGLGFARFRLAGHDRGGRVAHRLALDHPERLASVAVLDIVPTRTVFRATNQALATAYYHWFLVVRSGSAAPSTGSGASGLVAVQMSSRCACSHSARARRSFWCIGSIWPNQSLPFFMARCAVLRSSCNCRIASRRFAPMVAADFGFRCGVTIDGLGPDTLGLGLA